MYAQTEALLVTGARACDAAARLLNMVQFAHRMIGGGYRRCHPNQAE
jgi:hypothetical protein